MYVNTNYNSSVAQSNLFKVGKDVSQSMERLSSGLRINKAADDAAGLAISELMTAQTNGMQQALRNAQDGISLIQVAEGGLGTIGDMLQKMRSLAVQAANGTYSTDNLNTIQGEIEALIAEIDHIAGNTTFNSKNLLNTTDQISFQISDKSGDKIQLDLIDATSATLGVDNTNVDVTTDADAAITAIDSAIKTVADARAGLGAAQNRLDFITQNLQTGINNTSQANSRIKDADMAQEMSALTRAEILQQTTVAMLGRANSQPRLVQQLLQG